MNTTNDVSRKAEIIHLLATPTNTEVCSVSMMESTRRRRRGCIPYF